MNPTHSFFLVVEGENDAYPNYESARISFVKTDPSEIKFDNLFICSPLCSVSEDAPQNIPTLADGTIITFLMVPSVFPSFQAIIPYAKNSGQLWFSLGLSNLVIIENNSTDVSNKIIEHLKAVNNLTAYERWEINGGRVKPRTSPFFTILHNHGGVHNCDLKISKSLPFYLKFAVSEYIISVNKFLTASKKFTPHYYKGHLNTVDACNDLVNDLGVLFGDKNFKPSISLVQHLNPDRTGDIYEIVTSGTSKELVDELINDRHGRIIQFNSSMSYIYSQAYAGTFPIFDHIGIIRRHSLLGVGTAISALQEILIQMETSLWQLPFENLLSTEYTTAICPPEFTKVIINPGYFDPAIWKSDPVKIQVIDYSSDTTKKLPENFYNRLSFFSGRLGFREYEFSATAAIQVLVEAHSLKWHIINYTHEIIHNHVRLILNHFIDYSGETDHSIPWQTDQAIPWRTGSARAVKALC
ncbi:hypothetical protein [Mucilaginibacter flavidus]|uniref:hypothetical protein n=1 Tax=Mucilaginibacter flavidus TaxID=2949309 RepID=UPI0020921D1A|nr:hypothetical protein [Mucilaginibacter flavidus]MCO5948113.1 hypothetical protein [Mucilaginibacter flavidus]